MVIPAPIGSVQFSDAKVLPAGRAQSRRCARQPTSIRRGRAAGISYQLTVATGSLLSSHQAMHVRSVTKL